MLKKTSAYIFSFKFSPGLKKEFALIGENIRRLGFDLKYVISEQYKNIGGELPYAHYTPSIDTIPNMILSSIQAHSFKMELYEILSHRPPSFVCFYNSHPLNLIACALIRKYYPHSIIALFLHDPYKEDKRPYGLMKALYISGVEVIQKLSTKYADIVISPSEYSSKLFLNNYRMFKGKNIIVPLLIPDLHTPNAMQREYFTIVGGAHHATGHDTFIKLVNYSAEQSYPFKFAIISSSNLQPFLKDLTLNGRKKLHIINKKIISDEEINDIIRKSFAVFRLDTEVTQSGVIPVSYMNMTPVISRDIAGLSQHVQHAVNGYIVRSQCTSCDLIMAMRFVIGNIDTLAGNARSSYEQVWAESNFIKNYKWLDGSLGLHNV